MYRAPPGRLSQLRETRGPHGPSNSMDSLYWSQVVISPLKETLEGHMGSIGCYSKLVEDLLRSPLLPFLSTHQMLLVEAAQKESILRDDLFS